MTIYLKRGVTTKKLICRYACLILTVLSLFGLTAPLNGILCPAAYATAKRTFASGDICVVTVRRLNVRYGPSTKNKVIATLKKGTKVMVEKTEKGSWSEIICHERHVWIASKYLKKVK